MENNLQNDNSFNVEPDTDDTTQISPVAAAESEPAEAETVTGAQPEMFPAEPFLINNETIFIGDSLNDYSCAKKCEVYFIGMASTEKKKKRLQAIEDNIEIVDNYFRLLKHFEF